MLRLYRFYLQAPATAPTLVSGSTGATYKVAHRRLSPDGFRSAISPPIDLASLPATLDPESYQDAGSLHTDGFIASNDGGATWREVPRPAGGKGRFTIPAWDNAWVPAQPGELQGVDAVNLNFGQWSAMETPTVDLYLMNRDSQTLESFSVNIVDTQGRTYEALSNRVSIAVLGKFDAAARGNGALSASENSALTWVKPSLGDALFTARLTQGQALKLRLSLVNFPATGFNAGEVRFSIEIVPNLSTLSIAYGDQWQDEAIWLDWGSQFYPEFISGSNGNIEVARFAVRYKGRVIFNPGKRILPVGNTANGDYYLVAYETGRLELKSQKATDGATLGKLSVNTGNYVIGSFKPEVQPRNPLVVPMFASEAVEAARFVKLASDGKLKHFDGTGKAIGVSGKSAAANERSELIVGGFAWVTVAAADIPIGARVGSDGAGLAVSTSNGNHLALSEGKANGKVLISLHTEVSEVSSGGSGGVSDHGELTGLADDDHPHYLTTDRVNTWLASKNSDAIAQGTSNLYLTSAERIKLSGIQANATANQPDTELLNRANHTGTQPVTSLQRGSDGQVLVTSGSTVTWAMPSGGSGGATDHGTLTGLGDDDHQHYLNNDRVNTWFSSKNSDQLTEGSTNRYMTAAEKSKLSGVASGATANQTDNYLLNRVNHTGTQPVSAIAPGNNGQVLTTVNGATAWAAPASGGSASPGEMPIGSIIWWHKTDATGVTLPSNWVECNGQWLSDPASPFHNKYLPNINGGNGQRSRFIRGSLTSGSEQNDAFQGHCHNAVWDSSTFVTTNTYGGTYWGSSSNNPNGDNYRYGAGKASSDTANGTPRIADETRPRNVAMVAIMRIK